MAEQNPKNEKADEKIALKGRYNSAIGRRKTAVARVRLYRKGSGVLLVNDCKAKDYFDNNQLMIIRQPLKLTGHLRDLNFSVLAKGGSKKSQAEAVRHGIARLLVVLDEEAKPGLKAKGWLTRDARKKERKKPGLKKARRAPQWSKR